MRFHRTRIYIIIEEDRYEWENLATSHQLVQNSGLHIFVRDIYKQWYVNGINTRIDSISKLLDYLKELTQGYEIVTVGNSAGGYMAVIAAGYLNASYCFNFAGQVSIWDRVESNQLLKCVKGDVRKNKYFDTRSIYQDTRCRFYYFYAKKNLEDCEAFGMIADKPNVYGFGFKQRIHGVSMFSENMIPILCSTEVEMDRLARLYSRKTINRWEFLIRTTSIRTLCMVIWKRIKVI